MTEKELKKLNRYQLLEMLIIQTERAEDLQRQLEVISQVSEEAREELRTYLQTVKLPCAGLPR
mgnify:CR=1 FL=1